MKTEERFLEITQEIDRVLSDLCDAALKKEGMKLLGTVNQLISAIQKRD